MTQKSRPVWFSEILTRRAAESGDRLLYTFLADGEQESEHRSYWALYQRSIALARRLRDHRQERALLLLPPGLTFADAFFGCLYAGVIAVPCHVPTRPRHLPKLLGIWDDARPAVVLSDSATLARLEKLCIEAGDERLARCWKVAVDEIPCEDAGGNEFETPLQEIAFLQYTSGSTSDPKGVIVTHANLLHNEEMIRRAVQHDEDAVTVGWLPLHHDMGLMGNLLQPLYTGGRAALMPPSAFLQRPARWLAAITKYRAWTSGGPDFAYGLCLNRISNEERATFELSSWRTAFSGAEPVRAQTIERFSETFASCGFRRRSFYPCYGLAEATLFVTGGSIEDEPVSVLFNRESLARGLAAPADGSQQATPLVGCGRPWMGQRVDIFDPQKLAPVEEGSMGEIWLAGESITAGYWNRPADASHIVAASREGISERYLRTGDLGFLRNGELFIAGRLKDLIIVRGRNLYPQDLELAAERAHASVEPNAGAAFSIELNDSEEVVIAIEIRRGGQPRAEEIAEAVREAIAAEFEISVFDVVLLRTGTLPRTTSGKVQRSRCRTSYLAGTLDTVSTYLVGRPVPRAQRVRSEEPLTDRERSIRNVVAEVLRVPAASLTSTAPLLRCGLDSLRALEVCHRMETELGLTFPVAQLLDGSSVREIAANAVLVVPQLIHPLSAEPSMTAGQKSLYALERLARPRTPNNLFAAGWSGESLDAAALRKAALLISRRHAALRTTFLESCSEIVPRVHDELPPDFGEVIVDDAVEEAVRREAELPFDLENGPLFRVRLFRASGNRTALLIAVHHLVADLWSLEILFEELAALYSQETGAGAASLPNPQGTYQEYAASQKELLRGDKARRDLEYWRAGLAEVPPLNLPADRPRPASQTFDGAVRRRTATADILLAAKQLAAQHGTTLFSVLTTAFQAVLHRYTGQPDILIGAPLARRWDARFARTIGYFVDTLPLRADLHGDPSFSELLVRNRAAILGALAHVDVPSSFIAGQGGVEEGRTRHWQAVFALEEAHLPSLSALPALALGNEGTRLECGRLRLRALPVDRSAAQFDLLLYAAEAHSGLQLTLEYNTDLFEASTADRLLKHFEQLLKSAVRTPDARISELPMLDTEEVRQQLAVWNLPPPGDSTTHCLPEIFGVQARAHPDAIAVVSGSEQVTYGELDCRASNLAAALRHRGVRPDVMVALYFEPGIEMIVAILAVLKAGGAYVPLDPQQPTERLKYILGDSLAAGAAPIVLTSANCAAQVDILAQACGCDVVVAGTESSMDGTMEPAGRNARPGPENLAYVIYTSGSTGRPKGVMVTHANVVRLFERTEPELRFSSQDVWSLFHSYSFDFSVWEIWGALLYGGKLVIVPREVTRSPRAFLQLLRTEGVTVLSQTPSAFDLLTADAGPWGASDGFRVRAVVFGGEALDLKRLESWCALYEGKPPALINMYGITETTVHVTYCPLERNDIENNPRSLIGRPIRDLQVYLLDEQQRLLPRGAAGEICVGGAGLARGYLGRPGLTAERFIPNPFSNAPGARLYRSGDLGRYLPDGSIEYLGRLDHQVKIRGHRIEIGEVQHTVGAHPDVRQALVVARKDRHGATELIAYITCVPGAAETERSLRTFLSARIPAYMIPASFVPLDAFPLTANGKIDLRALPLPESQILPAPPAATPFTPTQAALAAIWAELLGVPHPALTDNFFDAGGHSLTATYLVNRIRRSFGVGLAEAAIFRIPEFGAIAAEIDRLRLDCAPVASAALIPSVRDRREAPLSFAQERIWISEQLNPQTSLFHMPIAFEVEGPIDTRIVEDCLRRMIQRHGALRSYYVERNGQPAQFIAPAVDFTLPVVDLRGRPEDQLENAVRQLLSEAALAPFNLGRPPLLRTSLLRLGDERHVFFINIHHIVSDLWSVEILLQEFMRLYGALSRGQRPELGPEPAQFADYAAWERSHAISGGFDADVAFWREKLDGADLSFTIPTDRPRPHTDTVRGSLVSLPFPGELTAALHGMERSHGVTLYVLLLTAFQVLLARCSGRNEVLVGTDMAVRDAESLHSAVGLFVNQVALSTDMGASPTFSSALTQVRNVVLEAMAHRSAPVQRIVDELSAGDPRGRSRLFRILFGFQSYQLPSTEWLPFRIERRETVWNTSKYDLSLLARQENGELVALLEYRKDLFDESTARRILTQFQMVLEQGVQDPGRCTHDFALLSEPLEHRLASVFNESLELA
jgi:amino acid adenylation domain-containing protein